MQMRERMHFAIKMPPIVHRPCANCVAKTLSSATSAFELIIKMVWFERGPLMNILKLFRQKMVFFVSSVFLASEKIEWQISAEIQSAAAPFRGHISGRAHKKPFNRAIGSRGSSLYCAFFDFASCHEKNDRHVA